MSLRKVQGTAAISAATMLQHLDPGPLAELRRMTLETGAPVFWRFAARHQHMMEGQGVIQHWINIVHILAILTPKGDPATRKHLHDSRRRLGEVLCDGGDPGWTGPRPVLSDHRLTQLIAARESQRAVLLVRAARMLARSRIPGSGVNVPDIALTLLEPKNGRLLAEPYYRRLDWAEFNAEKSQKGADE